MIEMDVMNEYGVWNQWWHNFYNYYVAQGVDMEDNKEITRTLAEWRAIDRDPDSTVFYFENEQDQLLFMLRWS